MERRLQWVDTARGVALVAMAGYHFAWDLAAFRWIDAAVILSRPFHLLGHAIAALFLLLSGYSLALARRSRGHQLWRDARYWRRWAQIAAGAGAITLVSFQLFPDAPIFFGILHCIALSSLIALPFVEAPAVLTLSAAALALAAPALFVAPVFDAKIFWWTGLSTITPSSNDYRPLLPWLGFVLLGVAAAKAQAGARLSLSPRTREAGSASRVARPLVFLGRHSLAFYLIHQPILYGALALIGPQAAPSLDRAGFMAQCVAQCSASDAPVSVCESACACVVARAKAAGRWRALVSGTLDGAQKAQAHEDAVACYADAAGGPGR
jgi:uncharacterized membrane protein